MNKAKALIIIIFSSPLFALAAAATPQTINEVFGNFTMFAVQYFLPVLVAVGFVTFITGVLRFVGAGDNEEKRQSGKNVMVFGIVVLFVMLTFWGFVNFLSQSILGSSPQINNYLPPLM